MMAPCNNQCPNPTFCNTFQTCGQAVQRDWERVGVYPAHGGFKVSAVNGEGLQYARPGVFDSPRTASWAVQFSDAELEVMADRVARSWAMGAGPRHITREDMAQWQLNQRRECWQGW